MTSKPKVKANKRLDDFPNDGLAVLDGNLYCNFCDCHVSWLHKSDVLKHTATAKHGNAKKRSFSNESAFVSNGEGTSTSTQSTVASRPNAAKRQRSMGEMVSATNKKSELISDLITIFAVADIPLQKVDALRPFLRKHVNNGGSIPGSSQLRETYLPRLLPEIESAVTGIVHDADSLSVILDEMTDNTDRIVLDILFKLPNRDKPLLVQTSNLSGSINHQSVAQCVVEALGKCQVPLTKGVVDALVGDGASYITKAYTCILKPLIPNLMRIWCMSHQLNLVGERWRDHPNNALMKNFLSAMNSMFSHSIPRKVRFQKVCQRFGLPPTLLPQYNATRWNSWYECVVANHFKLAAIPTFISEECALPKDDTTPQNLLEVKELINDQSTWFTVSLLLAFTTLCMKRLSTTLDLFQARSPQSHLVKGRMDGLISYYDTLSTSLNPEDFGIQSVING